MLDINKIAQDKINSMHDSGELQKYIEEKVEKLVLDGIESAINGYTMRRAVEENVSKSVSSVVADIDFSAYNTFIADKVKEITTGALREDVAKKIQDTFNSVFIKKHESFKLSGIFNAYRDMLIENLDESEQYELNNNWYADLEIAEYGWLEVSVSKVEPKDSYSKYSKRRECDFAFTVHRNYKDKTKGYISSAKFSGVDVKTSLTVKPHDDFELLILNLLYNETPIDIDIEDEYDIDTSLSLDI